MHLTRVDHGLSPETGLVRTMAKCGDRPILLCVMRSIGSGWYLFQRITYHARAGMPTTIDVLSGLILIVLVMECTRRIVGNALTFLPCFFDLHALGELLPHGHQP